MKILVTGAAGFIGTNFIYYELDKHPEDRIVALDLLTYAGNLKNLDDCKDDPLFSFVRMDITDKSSIFRLFSKESFDVVINFAAESHVDRSINDPKIFLKTNIIGTEVLMDACVRYGVKRFHQVSTDEVYGDLPLEAKERFFNEDSPLRPSSPYSASKASADLLVMAYVRTFGLNATVSRCSNNYGPYQFPEKLIPLIINNALNDKPLPVYGNGLNVRDWLHVSDHCRALDLIIREGKTGELYNIGAHNERSNIEVVKMIIKELGKSESLITYVQDRKGHDLRYAIDPSKIEKELGWKPVYGFEDGLKETIRWYLDNKTWLNDVISGDFLKYYENMYGKREILYK